MGEGGTRKEVFYTSLVFSVVLLIVRKCVQWLRQIRSMPPGPWGLPFVGCLPFIKSELHLHFFDLAKKYGSVFSTRLGSQLVVVISDPRIIRETFIREESTGRPNIEFINILEGYGEC